MNKKIIQPTAPITTSRLSVPLRARISIYIFTRVKLAVLICLMFVSGVFVFNLLSSTVAAEIQGFSTKQSDLTKGITVAVKEVVVQNGVAVTYIEKSSISRANKTIGVVVDQQTGSVTASEPGSMVYVANSGTAAAYVSDLNGTVKNGDLLTASPLEGVLMRSVEGDEGVIGVAMQDFPSSGAETVTLKTTDGQEVEAKLAAIQINMDTKLVKNSPGVSKTLLQKLGEALVRREVTAPQAFVATIILALLIVVEGGIIYAAVSSSIISLGRNPFARKTILRSLLQVTILIAGVLAVGLAATYLVLWI